MTVIRVGTTEGRFRMVMPSLMREFRDKYGEYDIRGVIGNAVELRTMLEKGEIDMAFSGITASTPDCIRKELLFQERLYLVISRDMLERHFPGRYPECLEEFENGVDISLFRDLPFSRSLDGLHCMQILDSLLEREGIKLNFVHTSGHFDLHQDMARENIALCFSLSMYLPHLYEMNRYSSSVLFAFPIRHLEETNPVYILTNGLRPRVRGTDEFVSLLRKRVETMQCSNV